MEELAPQLQAYLGLDLSTKDTPTSQILKPPKPLSFLEEVKTQGNAEERSEASLDAEEQQILATIGLEPLPIDQIVIQTGLTTDVVSSMLLMLELQGYITACGGGRYKRL